MTSEIRRVCVPIIGAIPDNIDDTPIHPPNGFIWMIGTISMGSNESFGFAECRLSLNGDVRDFTMCEADLIDLQSLIEQTLSVIGKERRDSDEP